MTDDEVKILTKEYLNVYFEKYAKENVKSIYNQDFNLFLQKTHSKFIKEMY